MTLPNGGGGAVAAAGIGDHHGTGPLRKLRGEVLVGTAASMAIKMLGTGLSFASAVLLARLMGVEGYGVYAHAMAVVTLLAIPTELGLPQLVVRQTARYHLAEEWGLLRGLLTRGNQAVLTVSLALAVLVGSGTIFLGGGGEEGPTFLIALLTLPLIALAALRMATLRGLRHVVAGQIPEVLVRPGVLIVALLIAWAYLGGSPLSAPTAMAMQVGAAACAFMVGAFVLLRWMPEQVGAARAEFETRQWLASAVPFMFIGGMQIVNKQLDLVMIGFLRPVGEVGVYRAAVQLAMLVTFMLSAINSVLAPQFARLWMQGDLVRLQHMVTKSARLVAAVSLPTAIALTLFGSTLIKWTFGVQFVGAALPLSILCVGQVVNAVTGSVAGLLHMTGHERDAARGVALAAASNVVLNFLLIPVWGMAGGAVATTTSYVIWNLYMFFKVRERTGLNPTSFGRGRSDQR